MEITAYTANVLRWTAPGTMVGVLAVTLDDGTSAELILPLPLCLEQANMPARYQWLDRVFARCRHQLDKTSNGGS